jgi:putative DNA primase/helicase
LLFKDVLARFGQAEEQSDGGYLALCPAHKDSRPSLRIWRGDDNKVRITCRSGCKPDEVVKAANLTWSDMFNATGEGLTVTKEKPALVGTAQTAALAMYVDDTSGLLQSLEADYGIVQARTYLHDRFGVSAELARELELGYSGPFKFPFASRAFTSFPRVTVPFKNFRGIVHALQGRDLSGKCPGRWVGLTNPEGARWGQYGVFRGQGGYGVTLITEGPGDALTAAAVGYDAVAIRGAALAGTPELVEELARGLEGSQVIVAGDNDTAGMGFTKRLSAGLSKHGITVYMLQIPTDGWDLTDWRKDSPEDFPAALHKAVKRAEPYSETKGLLVDAATGALVPDATTATRAVELITEFSERYGTSDVLSAHALVAFTGGTIKYAKGLGFYVWDGKVWHQSETKVRQLIHFMGASLSVAASTIPDAGEHTKKIASHFMNTRSIDALIRELKAVPAVQVSADEFDARPELLSFSNGTVDLRTGELRAHNKADMLTASLPIEFDPDAKAPRFEAFLSEIMPGLPDMPAYLRRLCGYGISGSTSEQCFAVLHGSGANGKSVLTDTLTEVFGQITTTTAFSTFEDKGSGGIPNDIAALRGARLVMASEGDSGRPMSEAVLKRVTGKDKVTARFMRQEFFTFAPTFLIMLATNHKPNFKGQDEGLWRRVKMIPFNRYFAPDERDYDLSEKLLAESAGIVAWAVRGAVEWFANGLQDPAAVKNATKEFRETADGLQGFMPGVLEATGNEDDRILGNEAFSMYLDWCEAENLPQKERWRRTTFYRAMEERKVTRRKTAQGITLFGVRPMHHDDAPAGPGIFGND